MKKTLILLSCILALTLILSGCASKQNTKTENNAPAPDKNQTGNINENLNNANQAKEIPPQEDKNLNVTEDDLNNLKAEIQNTNYDDLNSLSQ